MAESQRRTGCTGDHEAGSREIVQRWYNFRETGEKSLQQKIDDLGTEKILEEERRDYYHQLGFTFFPYNRATNAPRS
jgi:hypothetical protein